MRGKHRHEGPSRLDMVKVWLLDPRSRLAVRRRLAGLRVTRRSVLAAGMAVWLLYAGLVWQFGGRRLENCSSLACRALLGGLPIGPGRAATPAAAAGSSAPAPTTGAAGGAPATAPTAGPATTSTTTTTITTTSGVPFVLVPETTGAPPATAGEPTSTTAAGSTEPGPSTTTTTAAAATTTTTTAPQKQCKPKKHRDCKPKKPHPALPWWWPWRLLDLAGW